MTGVINLAELCSCKPHKINRTDSPAVIKMKFGVSYNTAPANYAQVIYPLLRTG